MGRQIVLEVTQPFHKSGTEVLYQPGDQLPLGADLPAGISVREVVVDAPDEAPKDKPETSAKAPKSGARD